MSRDDTWALLTGPSPPVSTPLAREIGELPAKAAQQLHYRAVEASGLWVQYTLDTWAEELGCARSTAHDALAKLVAGGLAERDESRTPHSYRLSYPRLAQLAESLRQSLSPRAAARVRILDPDAESSGIRTPDASAPGAPSPVGPDPAPTDVDGDRDEEVDKDQDQDQEPPPPSEVARDAEPNGSGGGDDGDEHHQLEQRGAEHRPGVMLAQYGGTCDECDRRVEPGIHWIEHHGRRRDGRAVLVHEACADEARRMLAPADEPCPECGDEVAVGSAMLQAGQCDDCWSDLEAEQWHEAELQRAEAAQQVPSWDEIRARNRELNLAALRAERAATTEEEAELERARAKWPEEAA